MKATIVNTSKLPTGGFLLNNLSELPSPREQTEGFNDFASLSKYYNCAIFGEDFNSVFVIKSQPQAISSLRIAFVEQACNADSLNERLLQLLIVLQDSFENINIFINRHGVQISNVYINRVHCRIMIDNRVFQTVEQIFEEVAVASQEACFFNGQLLISDHFLVAISKGLIYIDLTKYRHFYEAVLFKEFCKGFSIVLPDFEFDPELHIETIEHLIFNIPERYVMKTAMTEIIILPTLTLIPTRIEKNEADCTADSWYSYPIRRAILPKRHNTRIMSSGDIEDFYVRIQFDGDEWICRYDYETKNCKKDVLESYMMHFPGDYDIDALTKLHKKKMQQLINRELRQGGGPPRVQFVLYEKAAEPPSRAELQEKWYGSHYKFRI